jgi:very-short-patch-repair endonuclease
MTGHTGAASPERTTFEAWRGRLIDRTRRNRLLHFPHPSRETASAPLRIIDTDLSAIWSLLADGRAQALCPLPDPGPPPPDEQRDPFHKAYRAALKSDEAYIAAIAGIRPNAPDATAQRTKADTALRERLRAALGMDRRIRPDTTDAAAIEAYARGEGFRPDFELATGHRGIAPQHLTCLALPAAFEKRAERLLKKAAEVERETGVATLHLALGFLEWTEADSSELPLASPLLLLPVAITMHKTPSGRRFTISATDSQPSANLALGLRMEEDFGIRLPAPDGDASDTVGEYVAAVARIAAKRPGWAVRSCATVAHFSFARIAMWRDLDTANWPRGDPWDHQLVQPILRGTGGAASLGGFGDDHDPDDPKVAPYAPILVQDCDSSQHSAIIEAMRGRTLVIEGPPGTGKSQTIANLIANALHAGKTVLFVAEKQAALEVVRRRLDATGLGQFCLSLHGSGAKPADVIKVVKERAEASQPPPRPPRGNAADLARGNLRQHLDVMHAAIGAQGKTAHAAIGRLAMLEQAHPSLPSLLRTAVAAATALPRDTSLDGAQSALTALQDAARLADGTFQPLTGSPWQNLRRTLLQHEQDDLLDLLAELDQLVVALRQADRDFADAAGLPASNSAAAAAARAAPVAALEPQPPGARADVMMRLSADPARLTTLRAWVEAAEAAHQSRRRMAQLTGDRPAPSRADLSNLITEASSLLPAGGRLDDLDKVLADRLSAARRLIEHDETVTALRRIMLLPDDPSASTIEAAWRTAEHIAAAPPSACILAAGRLQDQMDAVLRASGQAASLAARRAALAARFDTDGHSARALRAAASALRASRPVLRWLSGPARQASQLVRAGWRGPDRLPDRAECARLLDDCADVLDETAAFDAHPLHRAWAGADTSPSSAAWGEIVSQHRGWQAMLDSILATEPLMRAAVAAMGQVGLDGVAELAPAARALRTALSECGNAQSWRQACAQAGQRAEAAQRALARARRLGLPGSLALPELSELRDLIDALARAESALADPTGVALLGAHDQGNATDVVAARATVRAAEETARLAGEPLVRRLLSADRATLIGLARNVQAQHDQATNSVARLRELGLTVTLADPFDAVSQSLAAMLAARNALPGWLRLASGMAACRVDPLARIVLDAFLAADASAAVLPDAAEWLVLTAALRAYANDNRAVFDRTGSTLDSLRRQYAEADRARLRDDARRTIESLHRRTVPRGSELGPKRSWTDMACLENEFGKKSRLLPLRELLDRAGGAVRALMPCWMMSPLTVAQFLKAGAPAFDLVVMDEASQIRPEDSLGALLRGAQAVIVGDTKQLPPTNFFDRALADGADTDAEDDDDVALAESVLDLGRQAFRPPRLLRWHYRSRDPALIAFSNRHFYDDKLIVFPAPHAPGGDLGIRLHEVMGIWQDRCNAEEARAICDAARRVMHTEPNRSLAIVAMNAPQKEMIEQTFEALTDTDDVCRSYRETWDEAQEPFVVKNLENVQGDERDIIMVSLGWGRTPDSTRPHQRFYPINRTGGERRLNVLITRARRRLEVFASLRAEDIVVGEKTPRGVQVLRDFLAYARDGKLERGVVTGADHDSDFEASVAAALQARGHRVEAQVGVASYRIDLAVRDPHAPDRFLVGIECDGATYHSARSARDRDRLRQKVLEDLGWRLLRVWSTDWFRARAAEVERLHAAILQMATPAPREPRVSPTDDGHEQPSAPAQPAAGPAVSTESVAQPSLPLPASPTTEPAGTPQEQAAQALRHYRDSVLAIEFPHIAKENGLLRRSMIDAMIAAEVTTPDAFRQKVPLRLREKTESSQLRHLPRICEIIGNHLE